MLIVKPIQMLQPRMLGYHHPRITLIRFVEPLEMLIFRLVDGLEDVHDLRESDGAAFSVGVGEAIVYGQVCCG
jgi:hypothetical protein